MRTLQSAKTLKAPTVAQHVAYFLNEQGMVIDNHMQLKRTNALTMDDKFTKNIMCDSRVCRGNTYARPIISESDKRNNYIQEQKRKLLRLKRKTMAFNLRLKTPPPVKGRLHAMVQTMERYEDIYHELVEREMKQGLRVDENHGRCSTDLESNVCNN